MYEPFLMSLEAFPLSFNSSVLVSMKELSPLITISTPSLEFALKSLYSAFTTRVTSLFDVGM